MCVLDRCLPHIALILALTLRVLCVISPTTNFSDTHKKMHQSAVICGVYEACHFFFYAEILKLALSVMV